MILTIPPIYPACRSTLHGPGEVSSWRLVDSAEVVVVQIVEDENGQWIVRPRAESLGLPGRPRYPTSPSPMVRSTCEVGTGDKSGWPRIRVLSAPLQGNGLYRFPFFRRFLVKLYPPVKVYDFTITSSDPALDTIKAVFSSDRLDRLPASDLSLQALSN